MRSHAYALALCVVVGGCDTAKLGTYEGDGGNGAMANDSGSTGDATGSDDGVVPVRFADCDALGEAMQVQTDGVRITVIGNDRMTFAIEVYPVTAAEPAECIGVCAAHRYFYYELAQEEQVTEHGPSLSGTVTHRLTDVVDGACACNEGSTDEYYGSFQFVQIDAAQTCGIFYLDDDEGTLDAHPPVAFAAPAPGA